MAEETEEDRLRLGARHVKKIWKEWNLTALMSSKLIMIVPNGEISTSRRENDELSLNKYVIN